jgi:hypothetical protein
LDLIGGLKIRSLHVARDLGHHICRSTPIVDVEITNDIKNLLGQFEYQKMDICCVGIIIGDQIVQIFREPDTDDGPQYRKVASSHVSRYKKMYAFNRMFEYVGLKSYLGLESVCVEEIKPFNGKGWTKDQFFADLASDGKVKTKMPDDPFHGNAALVIPSWARGDVESILKHNVVCLLKEHYILEHHDYLHGKYAHRIGPNGWYR